MGFTQIFDEAIRAVAQPANFVYSARALLNSCCDKDLAGEVKVFNNRAAALISGE